MEPRGGSYQRDTAGDYDDIGEATRTPKRRTIALLGHTFDQDLLVCKAFYFFFYSAFGSLFPLIAVYFKQLGMNATQAGILIGVRPFIEFASAPFWGSFADRFRKGKILLVFALVCWVVFTVAIGFMQPPARYCLLRNTTGEYIEATDNQKAYAAENYQDGGVKRAPRSVRRVHHTPGIAPIRIAYPQVLNYDEQRDGQLVRPPFSARVYRLPAVEEVFLLILLLIVLGEFFSAPAVTLVDACTLSYLADEPQLYGKQRMFGSLGWGVAMFFIGVSLDNSQSFANHPCGYLETHEKNYTLCFAVFSVLMAAALLTATQFTFPDESQRPDVVPQMIMDSEVAKVDPAVAEKARAHAPEAQESATGSKWLGALKTFSAPHYAVFLLVTWWMGFGIGLVFSFLFWHLQDLGGSPTLFGIASVINHVSEIAAYYFSFQLINSIGHVKVLYLGLFANCCRLLYVSWLSEPWWVLPFEFVQGISHAAVWAAATSYISLAAPAAQKSTAQNVLQGLHHGLGRGCGAIVGGILVTYAGTAVTFRIYGLSCLLVLLAFFAINKRFKADGFTYTASRLDEDGTAVLAPHGIPMNMPEAKLTDKFDRSGYGAADVPPPEADPTQDAYDRYVQQPYDKPVQFDRLPGTPVRLAKRAA